MSASCREKDKLYADLTLAYYQMNTPGSIVKNIFSLLKDHNNKDCYGKSHSLYRN